MFVASATAFAGDSDALKAILKAKTYADAETLINSSLSSLANDAEKAKAYNKLVDLAYEVFNEQNSIVTENQVNKQMGREEKPVDQALMAEMAFNARQLPSSAMSSTRSPTRRERYLLSSLRRMPSACGLAHATPSLTQVRRLSQPATTLRHASTGSSSPSLTDSPCSPSATVRLRSPSSAR